MNLERLNQIIKTYKEKYELINDPETHNEIYKWPAVMCCQNNWDIDAPDFRNMFKKSMELSYNIIENRFKHPINGIVFLCENGYTEKVRDAFRKLLSSDSDNIKEVQRCADAFQNDINAMLNEIAPEKWSYEQDRRDPLMYLAFIKPAESYMFKASPAGTFSLYMEYGNDIGSGQSFRLDYYYKLCDEVLEVVESDTELQEMLNTKLRDAAKLYDMDEDSLLSLPGKNKIMVYDIIYCSTVYNFFVGMEKPIRKSAKTAGKSALKKRIEELKAQIEKESAELDELSEQTPAYPNMVGKELDNIGIGKFIVTRQENKYIFLEMDGTEKMYALPDCISKGFLATDDKDIDEICRKISENNTKINRLSSSLRRASVELAQLE